MLESQATNREAVLRSNSYAAAWENLNRLLRLVCESMQLDLEPANAATASEVSCLSGFASGSDAMMVGSHLESTRTFGTACKAEAVAFLWEL